MRVVKFIITLGLLLGFQAHLDASSVSEHDDESFSPHSPLMRELTPEHRKAADILFHRSLTGEESPQGRVVSPTGKGTLKNDEFHKLAAELRQLVSLLVVSKPIETDAHEICFDLADGTKVILNPTK